MSSGSVLDSIRNATALVSRITFEKYDLVHSFSRLAYLMPVMPVAIPKLMSYQRDINLKTTAIANWLARGTLEFSAISRSMTEAKSLAGRWHIVPNGVSLETYTFRERLEPNAPLVFLGRMEEIKGPHLAIEVARRAGMKLVLAGNVSEEHRAWFEKNVMQQIDGEQFTFIGPVNDEEKNILLGSALGLVMPILWEEPFGIVMAEAMACGTPILALNRGAVPEVVAHGVTGIVGNTVADLVKGAAQLSALSRADCRRRVELFYSATAVTDGYLQVYRHMLSKRTSARTDA